VEFAVATVTDQNRDTIVFFDVDFSAKLNAMEKKAGVYINTRQATPNKQVEIFFKLTCKIDSSGDAVL
jgi:hypothetical protein